MEGIHGVDVSWLHHSHKDQQAQKLAKSSVETAPASGLEEKAAAGSPQANGHPSSHHHVHKPHILNRTSSEKVVPSPLVSPKSSKDTKSNGASPPARRNSWMSSISSKFSSASNAQPNVVQDNGSTTARKPPGQQTELPSPFGASFTPGAKEVKKPESSTSQQTPSPKSGSFISALRRLSSSSPGNLGKAAGSTGICERKTMNIDPFRERCQIEELEPVKLRKVAFCVDVEIAAPAKYTEGESSPPPEARRPSLSQLENQVDIRKRRDQSLKKSEGEALKNPSVVAEEKDKNGVVKITEEKAEPGHTLLDASSTDNEMKDPTRKREKKKRSEDERKERKERKKMEALANGTVPAELQRDNSKSSASESQAGVETPPKSQDRPTTDPLRIYRRCCQLRETPILKRITEQIGAPSACPVAAPGIISILDLSGYWMQLPDLITLSDYLAVVPVKRLILENCGLEDEGVRVILAGLLAAKTPEQAKHNKRLNKKAEGKAQGKSEDLGVVEKISFKNNPKVGREGWRHIALFLNMSRSIKAIDLSMIPFPDSSKTPGNPSPLHKSLSHPKLSTDIPNLLQRALAEKKASVLEELVMAECGLTTEHIQILIEGVIGCGITRLGLANNGMTVDGLRHVLRYVQIGKCEGLDLAGNNLRDNLHLLADSLDDKKPLYALSLADCSLSMSSLESLLPALVRLPNFRFIDLSHNHDLFTIRPSALGLLRKFIPQFPVLKRIHLLDVDLSSENAIALAEVLPESRSLAHLSILENKPLSALASSTDEASQEEACALYASLMVATRVSSTIVCIDVDVPGADSSEVVKALAKQVVAYSLRNLERTPLADPTLDGGISGLENQAHPQGQGHDKEVLVPDILLHLVGHVDGFSENHDQDEPAPDDDYIVGGTGVVKALGVCINRAADLRKSSRIGTPGGSGSVTPKQTLPEAEESKGKAKEMSKDLLGSARKIRARLLPALIKEAKCGTEISYKRLQFLDQTLERMIQRFENEYPETRIQAPSTHELDTCNPASSSNISLLNEQKAYSPATDIDIMPEDEEDDDGAIKIPLLRRGSNVSLTSHQTQEEGRMHRLGQRVRRDILRPETLDYAHGTTGDEVESHHLRELRTRLEGLNGAEIQEKVRRFGYEGLLDAIGATAEELLLLEKQDPESFDQFKEARLAALYNMGNREPVQHANSND